MKTLKDNLKFNPDLDYYTYQASLMFGVSYDSVTKEQRQQAKWCTLWEAYTPITNSILLERKDNT